MPRITDYGFSKMKTQISDMGYTLNRTDIDTSYNSATPLPGVIENDVSAEDVDLGSSTPDNSIPSEKISELNVEKLETGTIYSRQITLGVTDGAGDSYIGIGTFDPVTWTATNGILMGIDDSDSDKVKFYMGNATNWIDWNVTAANTLTIAGTLVAGEIHIPDVDTTANSFHVESDGSGWIGATSTNRATAPIQWTAAGVWDVGNGTTYMRMDGPNGIFKSSNYVADVSGFQITTGGAAEFENIKARGSLYGSVFKYDVVSAVGGQLLVSSADSLSTAMTALDASTMTIVGNTTFAANDMLQIKAVTASGIQEEFLRVTSAASAPTYSVTRDLAGTYASNSNPAWGAGTAVVKIGESDGVSAYSGGWLRLFGEGTNAPYYSVFSRTGLAYNSYSERIRMGNLNGIGGFVAETYGLFMGSTATGKYFSYDDTSGDLILNGSAITNESLFGDGSDGVVSINSGTTTLTSDMFYDTLTIASGAVLETAGYRVFVQNTLTNAGTIRRNGVAGGNGGAGDNGAGSVAVPGGTAGSAGTALADGSLPGAPAGKAGQAGGAGGGTTNTSANGSNGTAGTAGQAATKAIVGNGVAGGAGGAGGSGGGGAGGTSGAAGAAGASSGTILNEIRTYASAYLLYDPQDNTWYDSSGGSGSGGSGGGGGSQSTADGGTEASGGGGGGSGGSGSAGGVVEIFARILVNSGTISANGGNGGNGGDGGDGLVTVAGGAGGGGGGAGGGGGDGGVIILVYSSYTNTGSVTVTAGSAGSAGTGGTADTGTLGANDGSNGAAGTVGATGVSIALQI